MNVKQYRMAPPILTEMNHTMAYGVVSTSLGLMAPVSVTIREPCIRVHKESNLTDLSLILTQHFAHGDKGIGYEDQNGSKWKGGGSDDDMQEVAERLLD